MRSLISRRARPLAALVAVLVLVLTGCGGGNIGSSTTAAAVGGTACGTVNLAENPWVGYEASIHVVGTLAAEELGCKVNYKTLKEEVSWQGFQSGEVDVVIENWGHEDLMTKYIDQQKVAQDAGPNGNRGTIGWYMPPWMAKAYPDLTDWTKLNQYADLFKTSESKGKGQILDGDPSFVTNDETLVKTLKLNYEVVYAGSEAALVQSFRQAEKNRTPLLAYFYEPHWFFDEMKLVQVALPPYEKGCDADLDKVACGYPGYVINKIVATRFAESGSPAYALVKNFSWTNDDQDEIAGWIATDKMSPDAAARKWIGQNPDKVKAWLPQG